MLSLIIPVIVMVAAGASDAKPASKPAQHRPLRILFIAFLSFYAQ